MAVISWIKLNIDMFENRKIKQIRKLPDGDKLILLWVMLLTLAGKCNMRGYILLTEDIPYTAEMLATEFDMELNTVKMGLEIFQKFNMIELQNNVVKISSWEEHQNIEGMDKIREQTRARVKAYRERQKLLQQSQECNATVTLRNDIDIDIDKNKNKNINTLPKIKYAEFVSMTEDEYQKLVAKYENEELVKRMIEVLDNYKGANGKRYKSDYRAILNWVADKVIQEQQKKTTQPSSATYSAYQEFDTEAYKC